MVGGSCEPAGVIGSSGIGVSRARSQSPATQAKSPKGFGAYVPDLPGCVAVAKTRPAVVKLIHGAIEFHIEGLKKDGEPVPKASSSVEFVEVAA
jgi:predicted RNase H-like HicB family nuclease